MNQQNFANTVNGFNRCLRQARQIYLSGAQHIIREQPHLLDMPPNDFMNLMDDLHRGLLIKLFVAVAGADHLWTRGEENLAAVLFYHLWQRRLNDEEVREAIRRVEKEARQLEWTQLVKPFRTIPALNDRATELETVIVRAGNFIARADGNSSPCELESLRNIQNALLEAVRPAGASEAGHSDHSQASRHAVYEMGSYGAEMQHRIEDPTNRSTGGSSDVEASRPQDAVPGGETVQRAAHRSKSTCGQSTGEPDDTDKTDEDEALSLEKAIAELDGLIGMTRVKQEVKTLINFLEVQRKRVAAGLPETKLSLHMVFAGNPGTGKTTVARILGKIYRAMGILGKGHMIEVDRSGLVAEFAGQTGPKTNKLIDEALDGVLFIDEAYSLVSEHGDDPFGNEAVQALLKRMEDDRERLVVILAGYPNEMQRLIESNPGLSSRVGQQIDFADYEPEELGAIFATMCEQNEYVSYGLTRAKLLVGLNWIYHNRDKHFGNGRLVRNIFETAIRNLANRVVESTELTKRLLCQFEFEDIHLPDVPEEVVDDNELKSIRFLTECEHCEAKPRVPARFLGKRVKCRSCENTFRIDWAKPHL